MIPRERVCIWEPQPKQAAFITCPIYEVFFGGGRGASKTDGVLGDWMDHAYTYRAAAIGIVFRRELTQLEEMIARAKELYLPLGARWNEPKATFTMPGGARLKFRYLERDEDAMRYQGHAYTRIYIEEVTTFADPKPILKLHAALRSAKGVPCQMKNTGNPGGPGHLWVKSRYIDPAPLGLEVIYETIKTGKVLERIWIPALLKDNPKLTDADPTYVDRLHMVGSDALVRAWIEGDWDAIEGAYFDCWSKSLVIPPLTIPQHWTRFRSFDWGYAKPFSVGWWALAEDGPCRRGDEEVFFPRGSLIRYREWYGCAKGQPNVGIRLEAEDIQKGILERETAQETQKVAFMVCGLDSWEKGRGPTIAERMTNFRDTRFKDRPLVQLRKATTKRKSGWDQMRARMRGLNNVPFIYTFGQCADSIRTIPALQHDETNAEDLDTEGEDHAADDWRYMCMARPVSLVPPPRKLGPKPYTMDWLAKEDEKPKSKYRMT
jgi:hypothetical protein